MNPELTLFEFKAWKKYFWKERDDVKNNTVRIIDLQDERFLDLIAWNQIGYNDGDIQIRIVCDEERITRDIRDITIFNDMMIITWHPAPQVELVKN